MLGGDIRFHINQGHLFTQDEILLYIVEMGLVLDYLKTKRIIHRDIKPDNLLLDGKGHIHLTDFNIATWVPVGTIAVTLSGTKPYMAPEVYATAIGKLKGYLFEVDWWSLGVTICEMIRGMRPFTIHHDATAADVYKLFTKDLIINLPVNLTPSLCNLITHLLQPNTKKRICSLEKLKTYSVLNSLNVESVKKKLVTSKFVPSTEKFNCDPTYAFEEIMIEANPLHKKKKKKKKGNKKTLTVENKDPTQKGIETLTSKFTSFKRICSREDPYDKMSKETIAILTGIELCDSNDNLRSKSEHFSSESKEKLSDLKGDSNGQLCTDKAGSNSHVNNDLIHGSNKKLDKASNEHLNDGKRDANEHLNSELNTDVGIMVIHPSPSTTDDAILSNVDPFAEETTQHNTGL